MSNTEKIQSLLLSSAYAEDKAIFMAWERGEISTAACLRRFKIHNNIDIHERINSIDFEYWLRSLGYIRRFSNGKTETD